MFSFGSTRRISRREVLDRALAQYWQSIEPGDIVLLSDPVSFNTSLQRGGNGQMEYEITAINIVRQRDSADYVIADYWFYKLTDHRALQGDDQLWLLAKIVGGNISTRIYFEAPGFPIRNRLDLLHSQQYSWLYDHPLNYPSRPRCDWNYTTQIIQPHADLTFYQKDFGEVHGKVFFEPSLQGLTETVATVIEYALPADVQHDNPEILITEFGDNVQGGISYGGLVLMLQGCPIDLLHLEIL